MKKIAVVAALALTMSSGAFAKCQRGTVVSPNIPCWEYQPPSNPPPVHSVPVPGSLPLLGIGVALLAARRLRR
jgi:hypothetical protein